MDYTPDIVASYIAGQQYLAYVIHFPTAPLLLWRNYFPIIRSMRYDENVLSAAENLQKNMKDEFRGRTILKIV